MVLADVWYSPTQGSNTWNTSSDKSYSLCSLSPKSQTEPCSLLDGVLGLLEEGLRNIHGFRLPIMQRIIVLKRKKKKLIIIICTLQCVVKIWRNNETII